MPNETFLTNASWCFHWPESVWKEPACLWCAVWCPCCIWHQTAWNWNRASSHLQLQIGPMVTDTAWKNGVYVDKIKDIQRSTGTCTFRVKITLMYFFIIFTCWKCEYTFYLSIYIQCTYTSTCICSRMLKCRRQLFLKEKFGRMSATTNLEPFSRGIYRIPCY